MNPDALEGLRVLDLGQALTGPYSAMMLADMGADVISVERREIGDVSRFWPPFKNGISYYYFVMNRNKRSITLDLKKEEGREILLKLAERADVFLENFTPGTVDRLRIDYETIKKMNPKIIYCQISGYGQDGPYKDRRAMDLVMQGEGGLMSYTGTPDTPCKVGITIADLIAAMNATYSILVALLYREKTGEGQRIDVSMFDGQVAQLLFQAQRFWLTGKIPERMGAKHPVLTPYESYEAKDGKYVNICVINRETWVRFCKAGGLEHIMDDEKFATMDQRVKNREELTKITCETIKKKTRDEWIEILTSNGVPCGAINNVAEVLNHPQTKHRNMILEVDHPKAGKVKLLGIPIKLSKTPGKVRLAPPTLGQHTEEILKEIEYDDNEIKRLREEEVI